MERQVLRGDNFKVIINGSTGREDYSVVVEDVFDVGDQVERLKELILPPVIKSSKDGEYTPKERVVLLRELDEPSRSMPVWEGDIDISDGLIRFEKVEPTGEEVV